MEDTEKTLKNIIYKINYISNKRIDGNQIPEKIIIFYGTLNPLTGVKWEITEEDLKQKFAEFIQVPDDKSENFTIFGDIFSTLEIENIKTYQIDVVFSFQRLYEDDTIETIKKKIIKYANLEKPFSFDEIYLFSKRGLRYTPTQLYNKLSNNDTASVTKKSLIDFLTNSHRRNLKQECELLFRTDKDELKDVYTYEDIVNLFFRIKDDSPKQGEGQAQGGEEEEDEEAEFYEINLLPIIEDIPIGQRVAFNRLEYIFTTNPFNIKDTDEFEFLKQASRQQYTVSTKNKTLMLDYEPIICETIFLCLAEDVLTYVEKLNQEKGEGMPPILSENVIKIYYPYLAQKEYNTIGDLESNRQELIESTQALINDKPFIDLVENIDLFYDVYYQRNIEIGPVKGTGHGISYIELEIKPDSAINVPVDMLFKIIHTNEHKPLLKLTRGKKDQKMYRLYANRISVDGKRIPFLKSIEINKILKETQAERRLMVIVLCPYSSTDEKGVVKNITIQIKCEFDTYGSIFISFESVIVLTDEQVDSIISESINPVINEVEIFLSQNGYHINNFVGLYSTNVIIREIKYKAYFELPSGFSLNIAEKMSCISSIFNIISYKDKSHAIMRYKRVSNYNEAEGREAYMMEQFTKSSYQADVVHGLMENFKLSYEDAVRLVANFLEGLQLSEINKKSRIKINSHPGFLTTIARINGDIKSNCSIEVENIDNIYYIDNVQTMCDSLMRILLYNKSAPTTNTPRRRINELCGKLYSSKAKSAINEVKEVVAQGDNAVIAENIMYAEPGDSSAISFDFENMEKLEEVANRGDEALEDLLFGNMFEDEDEDADVAPAAAAAAAAAAASAAASAVEVRNESPKEGEQGQSDEEEKEKEEEELNAKSQRRKGAKEIQQKKN